MNIVSSENSGNNALILLKEAVGSGDDISTGHDGPSTEATPLHSNTNQPRILVDLEAILQNSLSIIHIHTPVSSPPTILNLPSIPHSHVPWKISKFKIWSPDIHRASPKGKLGLDYWTQKFPGTSPIWKTRNILTTFVIKGAVYLE